MEKKLQQKIVQYLKSKGCFVLRHTGAGVPAGTSDVSFYKEGFYGFIEVKARANAPTQPLQLEFIKKMNDWSWAKFVYPENWEEVKIELERIL